MTNSQQPTDAARQAITIRPARPTDAASIASLGAHVFAVTFGHSVEPHELQAYLEKDYSIPAIATALADPAKDTIVATTGPDDQICGFGVLARGSTEPCVDEIEDKVELLRLYVHPAAHGRGVGGQLTRTLERMAREQGFTTMWLGVWEENHSAQKAYGKWGYKKVGAHDFVIGSVVQTDEIMTKSL